MKNNYKVEIARKKSQGMNNYYSVLNRVNAALRIRLFSPLFETYPNQWLLPSFSDRLFYHFLLLQFII